jgi:hypothetical protein
VDATKELSPCQRRLSFPAVHGVWSFVFWSWLASRLLFLTAGALAAHVLSHAPTGDPAQPPGVFNYWANWDGAWYASIAKSGYAGRLWPASANFFPFYPILLRLGITVGPGAALAGVILSLAASLLALYFVHELTRNYFDLKAGRAATLALAFFPSAFFLNAVYTEAAFLAAALGSLWAARVRGDFVLAGVLGCIAAMTRNVGVLLVLPLADEWWRRRRDAGPHGLAALALVPAGLLAYMCWLWHRSGHPLLFLTVARDNWGRRLTNPGHTLHLAWEDASSGAAWAIRPQRVFETTSSSNPTFHAMPTFDYVFLLLMVVLVALAVTRLPRGLSAYAIAASLVPILTPAFVQPLASLSRYVLAVFPVFFVLGYVLSRRRFLLWPWLAASALLGVLFTLEFATWRWVA